MTRKSIVFKLNNLISRPVDYTEDNINKALDYQKSLKADMGGTEVLPALKAVYDSPIIGDKSKWRREIIFLTDGDVFNHSEVRILTISALC